MSPRYFVMLCIAFCATGFASGPTLAADGPERTYLQAALGYYSPASGWQTYKECSRHLEQPLGYSENEFVHLPIDKIDSLARSLKTQCDLYRRYQGAMAHLSLEAISGPQFVALHDKQETLVTHAEDAASKWDTYHDRMVAMGQTALTQRQFFDATDEERHKLFERARGSQRSTFQFMTGNYSADSGWTAYSTALKEMGLPIEESEIAFKNRPLPTIDSRARRAVHARKLVRDFKELCDGADKPNKWDAKTVYASEDLSKLDREYHALKDEWAARIVYATSCRQVGSKPNWPKFESQGDKEQAEVAVLSHVVADNFLDYAELCRKLGSGKSPDFVELSVEDQRAEIKRLSQELWDQRKETVSIYAKRTGEVLLTVALAYASYKVYQYANADPPVPSANTGRRPSQIDRSAFDRQRESYWREQAERNPGQFGANPENLSRMRAGRAPIGGDGFPMELHHPGGNPNATLLPMTRTEHRLGDNYMKNHPWMFEVKP